MHHTLITARHKLYALLQAATNTSVLKHFFIYSFGSFFLRSISTILVPFNMRKLTPSDYGTLSLLTAFITIATATIGMGLRQMLSLEFFHRDQQERQRLITEMIIIYTIIGLPVILTAWYIRTPIIQYVFLNTITAAQLAPTLITVFLFFYAELLYQLMQYERKAFILTTLQITLALISASITLVSLWVLHVGLVGIIWAQTISTAIATLLFFILQRHHYFFQISIKTAVTNSFSYMLYGLPFIPGIICSWMLSSADRWVLASYRSMHDVGIYAIADLFAQLFYTLVLIPWSGSYLPYIMQRYKEHQHDVAPIERENHRIMWISMVGATSAILIGFVAGRSFLYYLLPPSYYEAIPYILMLLLGQIFLLGSYFSSTLIQFHKKSFFLAFALALPALINLLLNLLLTPALGIAGCTIATLISYFIYFMMTYLYNKTLI